MTNIPSLFEYRMGVEATDGWGTAVAQTLKLMNVENLDFTPIVESEQVKDMRGTQAPAYQSVHNRTTGTATMSGWLNVEQFPYWACSLLQDVDPTTDADGGVWNWVAPGSDGQPDILSYTIAKGIVGDVNTVKSLRGATVQSMNITGATNQPLRITNNFIGVAIDTDTFDSDSEPDITTQLLTSCHTTFYIDPASDAVGTTLIENTGFSFDLNVNSNREVFNYLGSCTPGNYRPARFEGSLKLGLELNATSAAYLDDILTTATNGVFERVVRILMQIDTDNYIQVDFNGVALEAPQLYPDADQISTIDLMLMGQYNATLGNWLKVESRNTVDAI